MFSAARPAWFDQYWPLLEDITASSSHIDNEYSRAGIMDPKIVVTTSRDPSSKLLQFSKVRALQGYSEAVFDSVVYV